MSWETLRSVMPVLVRFKKMLRAADRPITRPKIRSWRKEIRIPPREMNLPPKKVGIPFTWLPNRIWARFFSSMLMPMVQIREIWRGASRKCS